MYVDRTVCGIKEGFAPFEMEDYLEVPKNWFKIKLSLNAESNKKNHSF